MNLKYILIIFVLAIIVGSGTFWFLKETENSFNFSPLELNLEKNKEKTDITNNQQFRDAVVRLVRKEADTYFSGKKTEHPEELKIAGDWNITITVYFQGEVRGIGQGESNILTSVLKEAVNNALADERYGKINKDELGSSRFLIRFISPSNQFSFIEYQGQGIELIDDLVPSRELDKDLIYQKIEQGKEFLFKMADEKEHGFHKYYYALDDTFENRLHTVYSASIIYTFLYLYDLEKDEKILENLSDWADFLLSMQNLNEEDERYGAFHYSFYLDTKEKEQYFVVGTSALNIFTLLRLYDFTGDSIYLDSAKLAGDWLINMQEEDGNIRPYVKYFDGQWVHGTKESLLYNGQVLSSLAKLYLATGEKRYYDAAKRIADRFAEKYEEAQGYIKGEYREKNPISNCWVVMSLMDFHRASKDDYYETIIFPLSEKILTNQKDDERDLLNYGGWGGAYSSSGMGWMSEVMTETYRFCQEERGENCEKYKESVIKTIRWIIQNTYSEENSYLVKNPDRAIGGVFWNQSNRYVRTDSVCHALNGYALIYNYLKDGALISLAEEPLELILDKINNPL